jgi:hypothetical protein
MENPPFLMGKSTISMAIFNSFLNVYQAGSFVSWRNYADGSGDADDEQV